MGIPNMAIIPSNNTTPIPMIHNEMSPHTEDQFNTTKIHSIPKPPPPRISPHNMVQSVPPQRRSSGSHSMRPRADSNTLLSPKEMEQQILSHYDQPRRNSNSKTWKSKMGFLKHKKSRKSKSNKRDSRSYSKSNTKPFNDEDDESKTSEDENTQKTDKMF